jgi:hypothetical protein
VEAAESVVSDFLDFEDFLVVEESVEESSEVVDFFFFFVLVVLSLLWSVD